MSLLKCRWWQENFFLKKSFQKKKSFGSSESWSFWKAQKRPRGDIEVDTLRFLFEKKNIVFDEKKLFLAKLKSISDCLGFE
jgi:hypothetical protein